MTAWTAAGYDVTATPLAGADQLDGRRVLDIRQRAEYLAGHLPGALHIELGDVAQRAADLPDEPTVVMCGHGERAMGAASLLERPATATSSCSTAAPATGPRPPAANSQTGT